NITSGITTTNESTLLLAISRLYRGGRIYSMWLKGPTEILDHYM
ncbi:MAG: hypothetical protein ACI9WS_003334, partial [Paraglaciecola psychrophila]